MNLVRRIKQWLGRWLSRWLGGDGLDPYLLALAHKVVRRLEGDPRFRAVVEREGNISFCPRCGQRPSADYRREEAFSALLAEFPEAKRSDVNLAIELAVRSL